MAIDTESPRHAQYIFDYIWTTITQVDPDKFMSIPDYYNPLSTSTNIYFNNPFENFYLLIFSW